MTIELIYIDNHLIVVKKPAGVLIQGDHSGDCSLFDMVKHYLKIEFNKPGNVYLGLVHRLDRPVSGVVVFARTSKAAARLAEQFRGKTSSKTYWALVQGKTPPQGRFTDYISRDGVTSVISDQKHGKYAELGFERLDFYDNTSFVKIDLKTGRHHQIRLQFAHRKFPILGDFRYGSTIKFPGKSVALHARSITLQHPTTGEYISFQADPDDLWPKRFIKC